MNRLVTGILILLTGLPAPAQQAWDSTYRPGNWEQRVEYFRSYPNSNDDIIFLGNSITHYADWHELLQLEKARNRGISGDITFGVLERLDEVTEGHPEKLFILIGINDIARNIPDSVILANYRKMIHRVQSASPGTKIYFQSVLPVNNSYPTRNHFNKDAHIAAVNAGLQKICMEYRVTLIDIHPRFLDGEGRLDKQFTYDGLHLNAAGYRHWAEILKPYIN
jgi:lysophospholipase L1-like esterase